VRQRVQMWGNSLSVRIPKAMAQELHLQPNSEVEMSLEASNLVIKPVTRPVYDLDELLSQVTPENLHGEVDWGPAVGKEVW
jgi:antitoxin MazE